MSPCGSTLRGGAGAASGVASWLFTLEVGVGTFCCCGISFIGVGTCVGAAMLKISVNCFRGAVCLLTNAGIGIVGPGLSRAWVRSAAACVVVSFEEILGNGRVAGENSVMLETHYVGILVM